MKSRKSRFWTFCLSFLPGCAEMYMGFMKMGLSLMTVFWGLIALAAVLNIGPLLFVALVAWFYSFFHARNMAHMPDAEFENQKDEFLLGGRMETETKELFRGENTSRAAAVILVILGTVFCLRAFRNLIWRYLPSSVAFWVDDLFYMLPQILIGVGIILLGCWMIRGKKRDLFEEEKAEQEDRKEEDRKKEDRKEEGRRETEDSVKSLAAAEGDEKDDGQV